jgi:hypothetical protein
MACGRCSPSSQDGDGGLPRSPRKGPEPLPAPPPLTFATVRGRTGTAIPERCKLRAPIAEAKLPASTRFLAEPRSLATLVLAEAQGEPPVLSAVAALTLDPAGASRDPAPIPWFDAAAMPLFARTGSKGGFIGALESPGSAGTARVDVWRGGAIEALGEGDHFDAVDLACDQGRCALLTTRLGKVAAPGADVWIGSAEEALTSWRRVEIIPSSGSDAHPLAIAGLTGVVAAIIEKGACVLYQADDPGGPREVARLAAPFGVLDVSAAPNPIAMTYGTPVDENGCTAKGAAASTSRDDSQHNKDGEDNDGDDGQRDGDGERDSNDPDGAAGAPPRPRGDGGAMLRFERANAPGVDVRVPSPPVSGAIRRLDEGALAIWLAPLGCGFARHVVYAVVLDASGAPVSAPMPIADGERFAAASSGDAVDLWLEREQTLTWIPLTCAAPRSP